MFELTTIKQEEKHFLYTWSTLKDGRYFDLSSGCIGHLRGDFGSNGDEFWTTWWDHGFESQGKTPEFQKEFDLLINNLREQKAVGAPLKNRNYMTKFCFAHMDAALDEEQRWFGFRYDTLKHSYFLRFSPYRGDYNFYVYCYEKETVNKMEGVTADQLVV